MYTTEKLADLLDLTAGQPNAFVLPIGDPDPMLDSIIEALTRFRFLNEILSMSPSPNKLNLILISSTGSSSPPSSARPGRS
jgi:hypothetical protein